MPPGSAGGRRHGIARDVGEVGPVGWLQDGSCNLTLAST